MVDWCRAKVSHLIDKFREYPILWDVRCVDEKNKNLKVEALDEISRALHVPVEEVTKKLHSLKVQFSREYCRVRKEKRKNGRNHVPKWYGYEQLLFLKDANTRTRRKSTFADTDDANSVNSNSDDLSVLSVNTVKEEFVPIILDKNESAIKRNPVISSHDHETTYEKRPKKMALSQSDIDDEFSSFGFYIANKLKTLNDPYLQAVAKHNINDVIFNIELKQCQRGLSQPASPITSNFTNFTRCNSPR